MDKKRYTKKEHINTEDKNREKSMAQSLTSENLQNVFTFPFRDQKWGEKFLIGSLLFLASFLLLPIFLIYGYFIELMRMGIEGRELSLPEWDLWEKKFTDGAKLFIIGLIFTIPFIILIFLGYFLMFAGVIGTDLIDFSTDPSSPFWAIPSMFGTFGGMALFGLSLLLVFVIGVFMPAATAHVVATDDLSAAFRFSEWWGIFRANLSGFVITYLLVFGLFTAINFVLQILYMTVILCCIAPFLLIPATLYIIVTTGVLFGQAYREGVQNLHS
jgi:hypothetical protein